MKRQNIHYIVACVILFLANLYFRNYHQGIKVPPSRSITSIPLELRQFSGRDIVPTYNNFYDPSADEKILRIYIKRGDNTPIYVFIGYWEMQDEKKKIHPPRYTSNQWSYYKIETKFISLASKRVKLRRFLMENGFKRKLVYYCYIVDNRIVSSEYYLRFLNMMNSLLYGRNNAALLRISIPITEDWPVEKAEIYGESFLKEILPLILEYV